MHELFRNLKSSKLLNGFSPFAWLRIKKMRSLAVLRNHQPGSPTRSAEWAFPSIPFQPVSWGSFHREIAFFRPDLAARSRMRDSSEENRCRVRIVDFFGRLYWGICFRGILPLIGKPYANWPSHPEAPIPHLRDRWLRATV